MTDAAPVPANHEPNGRFRPGNRAAVRRPAPAALTGLTRPEARARRRLARDLVARGVAVHVARERATTAVLASRFRRTCQALGDGAEFRARWPELRAACELIERIEAEAAARPKRSIPDWLREPPAETTERP